MFHDSFLNFFLFVNDNLFAKLNDIKISNLVQF